MTAGGATDFKTAQSDLAAAFDGGASGVLVPGLEWIVAGGVWLYADRSR